MTRSSFSLPVSFHRAWPCVSPPSSSLLYGFFSPLSRHTLSVDRVVYSAARLFQNRVQYFDSCINTTKFLAIPLLLSISLSFRGIHHTVLRPPCWLRDRKGCFAQVTVPPPDIHHTKHADCLRDLEGSLTFPMRLKKEGVSDERTQKRACVLSPGVGSSHTPPFKWNIGRSNRPNRHQEFCVDVQPSGIANTTW